MNICRCTAYIRYTFASETKKYKLWQSVNFILHLTSRGSPIGMELM
ncbi:hypothetical protein CCAND38_100021 [Capnocytophaga canis]|uniref:Uncharacterized protein n=1 Tax=Capnocytophaga canis TaxID=1848903 RepID=A0A0B7IK43_9FLAO|nr:hypothetical protein CCAND38_100021 [Capnocytophaga canis]CEN52206.1 hypothetical protein CCAND93_220035 [Capnocytophaga canis]